MEWCLLDLREVCSRLILHPLNRAGKELCIFVIYLGHPFVRIGLNSRYRIQSADLNTEFYSLLDWSLYRLFNHRRSVLQQQLRPKIKDTSLAPMKMYIFIAHVFSVKTSLHSPTIQSPTIPSSTIHSPTWKLKQNKCTHKCSKKGNTPRKWWFKSNQFKRIHVLTSFCLASDPQRKTSVLHAGQFEKDWIPASRCSGRKFFPHLPQERDRCWRQSSI